ncbi:MAG: pirin family protein [Myxococcota bacterium]|nr:pirin family protein [Myxococcota bacterium]
MSATPLGAPPWDTRDPFLFCVHHDDRYPEGNERMGPAASLEGHTIGRDFEGRDGWRMYHGDVVPGFPEHPHRGFETVTVVREGLLDHSDSMGATARYGGGDVQWLTAGRGIEHAEMFPLVDLDDPNPVELFQIWMNLPRADKMAEPHFTMLWSDAIPRAVARDAGGRETQITIVAGSLGASRAPSPPPSSWASREGSDVAIWTVAMPPCARWTLPAAQPGSNRDAYFFRGGSVLVDGREVAVGHRIELRADLEVELENGSESSELLLLQGRPIGEPVVQHGPFVMTTREEIQQAIDDFRRTRFGGWPWQRRDPVHPREQGRFARFADGRIERPV